MVKRCCHGTCNSDTRYKERLVGGVEFIPFPKPVTNIEKCLRWIKLCGRPHQQINEDKLRDPSKAKHFYVCSKHFTDGKPTKENPDPLPAIHFDKNTPARKLPKVRPVSEPAVKRRKRSLPDLGDSRNILRTIKSEQQSPVHLHSTDTINHENIKENSAVENNTGDRLEMLALAAENEALKKQVASLILDKEDIIRQKRENCVENREDDACIISTEQLRKNTKRDEFIYYTGLTQEQFDTFLSFLIQDNTLPFEPQISLSSQKNMKIEDQVLFVLMKLRQNFDFIHIGKLFQISQQDASMIFKDWIQYMYDYCGSVPIWPHRDTIIKMMPEQFCQEFPTTMVIIDSAEIKMQRPSSTTQESQCYPDYKSGINLKGLVGIEPRGGVIFASMLFSGSISDEELMEKSGFISTLKNLKDCGTLSEGDSVMADKGFKIEKELEDIGLRLIIPPLCRTGTQMSNSEIKLTEKIARHRVYVERAIDRIKSYKILSHKIDLSHFSCINEIWFVCCFLTNFMNFLIK